MTNFNWGILSSYQRYDGTERSFKRQMDTNISSIELAIQKKSEKLKPKSKKPEFLRSVIERQSIRIDAALAKG